MKKYIWQYKYKNIDSPMGSLSNLIKVNKILRRSNYDNYGGIRRLGKCYIAKYITNNNNAKTDLWKFLSSGCSKGTSTENEIGTKNFFYTQDTA